MKQIVTKDDVARTMAELNARGKKPTLAALHAALGGRGSMTTLVRLKAEILDHQPSTESQEALISFREIWARALDEGRKEQEHSLCDLRETVAALTAECDRLHGVAMAAQNRATELQTKCSEGELENQRAQVRFQAEVSRLRDELDAARQQVSAALVRVTEIQEACHKELQSSRVELQSVRRVAHEFELNLTRAAALLEANGITMPGLA